MRDLVRELCFSFFLSGLDFCWKIFFFYEVGCFLSAVQGTWPLPLFSTIFDLFVSFFFCSMHHWKWIHMASTSQGQSSIPSWSSNHQSQLINLPSLPSIHPPVPKPMEQGRAPPTQTIRTMVQTRPKPRKALRNRTSTELEITYTYTSTPYGSYVREYDGR